MFEDLNIRTTLDDQGSVYVSVLDLSMHLYLSVSALFETVSAGILEGTVSDEQATYFQGSIDTLRQLGVMLTEGGIVAEFNKELDEI